MKSCMSRKVDKWQAEVDSDHYLPRLDVKKKLQKWKKTGNEKKAKLKSHKLPRKISRVSWRKFIEPDEPLERKSESRYP